MYMRTPIHVIYYTEYKFSLFPLASPSLMPFYPLLFSLSCFFSSFSFHLAFFLPCFSPCFFLSSSFSPATIGAHSQQGRDRPARAEGLRRVGPCDSRSVLGCGSQCTICARGAGGCVHRRSACACIVSEPRRSHSSGETDRG
jgi:hypothetical protein